MRGRLAALRLIKKSGFVWRFGYNLRPTLDYALDTSDGLGNAERGIVDGLNKHGFAVASIDQLSGLDRELPSLLEAGEALVDANCERLGVLKSRSSESEEIGHKTFNVELLGSVLTLDSKCSFAQLALNETMLRIANAYFQMCAKLRYYNVWYTAASTSTARESQLWHFDREDNYILKVFLYLDDVDEGTGPFTYAPGTHRKGRYRSLKPEFFDEGGVKRTTDDQMAAVYPREKWKVCTGKKGTIIFADTRGYHKGGEARTKDRLMYTCMFTSPASESKQLIKFPDDLCLDGLTPRQRKALYL